MLDQMEMKKGNVISSLDIEFEMFEMELSRYCHILCKKSKWCAITCSFHTINIQPVALVSLARKLNCLLFLFQGSDTNNVPLMGQRHGRNRISTGDLALYEVGCNCECLRTS